MQLGDKIKGCPLLFTWERKDVEFDSCLYCYQSFSLVESMSGLDCFMQTPEDYDTNWFYWLFFIFNNLKIWNISETGRLRGDFAWCVNFCPSMFFYTITIWCFQTGKAIRVCNTIGRWVKTNPGIAQYFLSENIVWQRCVGRKSQIIVTEDLIALALFTL